MGKISILPAHLFLHIRMFINCIMFTKCKHWKFCKHSSNGTGGLLIRILQFGLHFRVCSGTLGGIEESHFFVINQLEKFFLFTILQLEEGIAIAQKAGFFSIVSHYPSSRDNQSGWSIEGMLSECGKWFASP